jgi:hypothetical protein
LVKIVNIIVPAGKQTYTLYNTRLQFLVSYS